MGTSIAMTNRKSILLTLVPLKQSHAFLAFGEMVGYRQPIDSSANNCEIIFLLLLHRGVKLNSIN